MGAVQLRISATCAAAGVGEALRRTGSGMGPAGEAQGAGAGAPRGSASLYLSRGVAGAEQAACQSACASPHHGIDWQACLLNRSQKPRVVGKAEETAGQHQVVAPHPRLLDVPCMAQRTVLKGVAAHTHALLPGRDPPGHNHTNRVAAYLRAPAACRRYYWPDQLVFALLLCLLYKWKPPASLEYACLFVRVPLGQL